MALVAYQLEQSRIAKKEAAKAAKAAAKAAKEKDKYMGTFAESIKSKENLFKNRLRALDTAASVPSILCRPPC